MTSSQTLRTPRSRACSCRARMSASPTPERRSAGTTPTPPIQASSPRTPPARAHRSLCLCRSFSPCGDAGVLTDELLREFVGLVVDDLLRRRFHEVRARADEGACDVVVERELRQADAVDDDPGGVRG